LTAYTRLPRPRLSDGAVLAGSSTYLSSLSFCIGRRLSFVCLSLFVRSLHFLVGDSQDLIVAAPSTQSTHPLKPVSMTASLCDTGLPRRTRRLSW
jgi:hypothetical protein